MVRRNAVVRDVNHLEVDSFTTERAMYLHGTRTFADRLGSGTRLAFQAQILSAEARADALPTATRLQRICRSARLGGTLGSGEGFTASLNFPLAMNFLHLVYPATRGAFGTFRAASLGLNVPTMTGLLLGSFLLGEFGKGRGGINLARPGPEIVQQATLQYGLLGLPEFFFNVAAAKHRAHGNATLAAACALGAFLFAAALELPRLAYRLVTLGAACSCALVLGSVGMVIGAVIGAMLPPLERAAVARLHVGADEASRAHAEAARRVEVPQNLVARLSAIQNNDGLREALRICTQDAATRTAYIASLEVLRTQLETAARSRGFIDDPETSYLLLLERLVGPLDDLGGFASAFRQRIRRIHPDRLSALRLDLDSEQLLMCVFSAMQAGNDLAGLLRTSDVDVPSWAA